MERLALAAVRAAGGNLEERDAVRVRGEPRDAGRFLYGGRGAEPERVFFFLIRVGVLLVFDTCVHPSLHDFEIRCIVNREELHLTYTKFKNETNFQIP